MKKYPLSNLASPSVAEKETVKAAVIATQKIQKEKLIYAVVASMFVAPITNQQKNLGNPSATVVSLMTE